MCQKCKRGRLIDNKISAILEKGNKVILIHNVACFFCPKCHYILVLDSIINQLQTTPGTRIKLLVPEDKAYLAA